MAVIKIETFFFFFFLISAWLFKVFKTDFCHNSKISDSLLPSIAMLVVISKHKITHFFRFHDKISAMFCDKDTTNGQIWDKF